MNRYSTIRPVAVMLFCCLLGFQTWAEFTLWEIAANRQSKTICSGVFLSGRTVNDILLHDLDVIKPETVKVSIDRDRQTVTIHLADGYTAIAIYRPGCGCTNLLDQPEDVVRRQPTQAIPVEPPLSESELWPAGERAQEPDKSLGINKRKMRKALDKAFEEPYGDGKLIRGTRGVAVIYDGEIVAERYAPGYTKDTPIIAWSMTKSIINSLVGILVKQGKLDIYAAAPVPEWSDPTDPRHAITTDHLLRMSSGLKFTEEYSPQLVDVVVMLYGDADAGRYAASLPMEAKPDEKWYYSSGTTNIISRIIRQQQDDHATYLAFPYAELFNKLGMRHTIMEPDASGTYVGSSFCYTTPRDMARFGQFLMQDGVWEGERILPEGWLDYSTTPTPKNPRGEYGAQLWLNRGEPGNPENRRWPHLPLDSFGFSGFEGQSVGIIPSRNAVIVRMGRTVGGRKAWSQDEFMGNVLKALPKE